MLITTLLSLPADLDLADVRLESEALTLVLRSNQTSSACPVCTKPSSRVHGTYTRTLADLPCLGKAVRVHLKVRRFVCRTRGCPRATFAERAATGKRQSKLDPFLPYLRKRWEQGCHNGLQLARELQTQGFRGSASLVRRLIGGWRAGLPGPPERVRGKK